MSPPREVPYDSKAEADLLGAMLLSRGAVTAAVEVVSADDFYVPSHGHVFDATVRLFAAGEPIDSTTVADELRHRGLLEAVGGPAALIALQASSPAISNAPSYARIVADYATRRRLIGAAAEIAELGYEQPDDVGAAVKRAQAMMAEVVARASDVPTGERPVLISVADVESESVRWLWRDRIPLAKLSVIDGDPDLGKSTITLDLGARVTTGSALPDGAACEHCGAVLVLSAEDGIADTLRPRLAAAGADLARVAVLDGVNYQGELGREERPVILPADVHVIEAAIATTGAVFVVIDPLSAFLSDRVDAHKDHDVRRALMPLARLAERSGAAILIVRHLSKGGGSNPLYRGGGSIGIIGAARSGLLVGVDPDDAERRVLTVPKHNLAPERPALAYRLVPDELHDCVRIAWEGTSERRPEDLLAAKEELHQEERSARDEAVEVLMDLLADGEQRGRDVKKVAAEANIAPRTLARARLRAGVTVRREGSGADTVTWWSLGENSSRATHATSAKAGVTGTTGTTGQKPSSAQTDGEEGGTTGEPVIRRLDEQDQRDEEDT